MALRIHIESGQDFSVIAAPPAPGAARRRLSWATLGPVPQGLPVLGDLTATAALAGAAVWTKKPQAVWAAFRKTTSRGSLSYEAWAQGRAEPVDFPSQLPAQGRVRPEGQRIFA